ncbi:MAG: aminodeoxychorismate lyase [Saccharospirillaceae bacterium]|nr:aminodeoxychorismate lyase [Saccharospirillaceae bacterium]MCD8530658.1 aminodeoxychorismate lyase [Saccharospirillaceae bacterium]
MPETVTAFSWIDGQWQSHWPLNDRALHYGDGLFETIRFASDGSIPLWPYHKQRLLQGLCALNFPIDSFQRIEEALAQRPESPLQGGKLLISRGTGPRGYAPPAEPDLVLQWQSFAPPAWWYQRLPQGLTVGISDIALAIQPALAGFKHLNRLEQVLARQRFEPHWQEAVMLDTQGRVIEGCMSNLFLLENNRLVTADLSGCGVNGVVRRWLLEQQNVIITPFEPERLLAADAVFFCNSLQGIALACDITGQRYGHPAAQQQIAALQQDLENLYA